MAGQVFISYSRTDRAYVDSLVGYLQGVSVPVWFDYDVEAGDSFGPKIQQAIDECGVFVVVLTPASAESEWVQREISRATRAKKPVRPLLLEPCNTPIELEGVQHEDVTSGQMPSPRFVDGIRKHTQTGQSATRSLISVPRGTRTPAKTERRNWVWLPVAAVALSALVIFGGVTLVQRLAANQSGTQPAPSLPSRTDFTYTTAPSAGLTAPVLQSPADSGTLTYTTAAPAGLAAPVLQSPADGATFTNFPRTLTLSWQAVQGATQYRIEIQCDICAATPWTTVRTDTTTSTSYSFTWGADNTGRWHITALNGDRSSEPSVWRTFAFHTPPSDAPVQVSPANGAVFSNYPRTTTLKWQAVPGAASYRVEVQCDVCGTTPWVNVVDKTIVGTSFTFDFGGAQSGRWRVTAIYPNGAAGTPSGFWTFTYTI
jgi:hypothetical protein